jgi:hypothetical protein
MQRLPWTAEIIMKTRPIPCAWLLNFRKVQAGWSVLACTDGPNVPVGSYAGPVTVATAYNQ